MCVVLVSCRRRCGVIRTHQHRCDVILTSHACWEDEQLLLCGIIAHAKSSVVHHRGLSAVGECKSADIQMECSIFVYRLNSFSISEEYALVHCRNYASHRISESYAELWSEDNINKWSKMDIVSTSRADEDRTTCKGIAYALSWIQPFCTAMG